MCCGECDCAEGHCREAGRSDPVNQAAGLLAGPGYPHCTEDHCAEEECAEETLTLAGPTPTSAEDEEEDPNVSFFICQMAFALIEGMVTPTDIYEGMVLANCGDKDVASYIRDKAVAEATLYRENELKNSNSERLN